MKFRLLQIVYLFLVPLLGAAQDEYIITIETTLGDTTETFWLQIPENYNPANPCPLLIGWHQWGGDYLEFRDATRFDALSNRAGWIAASHFGTGLYHWNNQATQSHVVDMIDWIAENYSVDADRIYMVGASMGGAAAMIFSNNHLDPTGPMVAAAASVSGIQDCERRFYEQHGNHTMGSSFGGTPSQVPFEYHRNSAIYFADSTESMHWNALHLPLFLTFGAEWSDSVWRCHAEDLYAVMDGFADTVVLHESSNYGHGWAASEDETIFSFLSGFTLKRYPLQININADAEGTWYWANLTFRDADNSFGRIDASFDTSASTPEVSVNFINNVNIATLDLPSLGYDYDTRRLICNWTIDDGLPSELSFKSVPEEPLALIRDGVIFTDWVYDAVNQLLTLYNSQSATFTIVMSGPNQNLDTSEKRRNLPIIRSFDASVLYVDLPDDTPITWSLYNLLGRRIEHRLVKNNVIRLPDHLPSGIYISCLQATASNCQPVIQKIIITR